MSDLAYLSCSVGAGLLVGLCWRYVGLAARYLGRR